MKKDKVLIIAPHMDDEALGCGGIICRHKDNHDDVRVIFVAHRLYNHSFDERKNRIQKKHALKAKNVLKYDEAVFLDLDDERLDSCLQDIIIPLEKAVEKIRPDIVYLPFSGDNNQDHRAVFSAARVVFRPTASVYVKAVHLYEIPSSTEQSPPLPENAFLPNYYVNIEEHIAAKTKAVLCYETEKRIYPHPRSKEAVAILAQKRGIEAGFGYAEAFVTIRKRWE